MPKQFLFTVKTIEKLAPPQTGRDEYRDTKIPSLLLLVSSTGTRTFLLYRRMPGGSPTRLKLGRWPDVSVETARKMAAKLVGEIAEGKNPAEQRRKARGETTLGELFSLYLEGHAKAHKRTWEGDEEQYSLHLKAWAARKLSAIRRADVAAWHAKLGKSSGQYAANRALALLQTMYGYAGSIGYEGLNPAKGVKRFREVSRERYLTPEEMPKFLQAVRDEPNEIIRDAVLMLLFTGARRANVFSMRWDELDLPRAVWTIPASKAKAGKAYSVSLSPPAMELLAGRWQHRNGCPFVFPARRGDTGHLTEAKAAWKKILERAGIGNLRIHDLRRTLGSWQAAAGVSLAVIGKSLGHTSLQSTQVYSRLDLDPVREAVNRVTQLMLDAKPEGGAK